MVAEEYTLGALFLSAFLSSTILPGGSEVVLAVLLANGAYDPWTLWGVATAGNTLGGMSSWGLGWCVSVMYPAAQLMTASRNQRALAQVQRWGAPLLLLSWVPIVGDPLCLAAGWLRVNALAAALFIGAGKAARYAAVVTAVREYAA